LALKKADVMAERWADVWAETKVGPLVATLAAYSACRRVAW